MQINMKEAEKQIPISVGVNNTKNRITIFCSNFKKKLVLTGIAVSYDTGIIGKPIVEINLRKELGTLFEWEIKSSGGNPNDYIWAQISCRGTDGTYAVLEAALKTITLENKNVDDFF